MHWADTPPSHLILELDDHWSFRLRLVPEEKSCRRMADTYVFVLRRLRRWVSLGISSGGVAWLCPTCHWGCIHIRRRTRYRFHPVFHPFRWTPVAAGGVKIREAIVLVVAQVRIPVSCLQRRADPFQGRNSASERYRCVVFDAYSSVFV